MADTGAGGSPPAVGAGSVPLTLGGFAAAFGATSCCGLPFLLDAAGIGTAWLTGFALLATPHRAALLIVGIVGLTGGEILLWRQQRTAACTPIAFWAWPAVRTLTLAGLLVGPVLLYRGYACA